jgi:thiosulfate/3-mercaptopyruvate sulfurtransferase
LAGASAAPGERRATYPRADLLAEPTDLAKPGETAKYRILDARSKEHYEAGHVAGAMWVDHDTWMKAFAAGQDPVTWSKMVGGLGIVADSRIVIYDDSLGKDAARIWWILRYWGLRDVRLLNGGWRAWQTSGGKITKDRPRFAVTNVKLTPLSGRLAVKKDLLESLKQKPPQIIDARSRREFTGEMNHAKRGGSIPGAIHREWSDVLDIKTGRFKSPAELTRIFKDSGIDPDKPCVTYCQSGGRAAVMTFALELMGAPNVRNYYRSWAEWGNDDATPIAKPNK